MKKVLIGLGVLAGQRQCPAVERAGPIVPAELARKRRVGAPRQRREPAAGALPAQQVQVCQGARVAALPAGCHRAQPQIVWCAGWRQRPLPGVTAERRVIHAESGRYQFGNGFNTALVNNSWTHC